MIAALISGGVDSLVAARLLVEQGHDVVGIHLLTGYNELSSEDIRSLSNMVGIPVETVDCRRQFQETIIDYFTNAYLQGKTPNPCLWCNPRIKFGLGWEYAQSLGAEKIASGHYCRIDGAGDQLRLRRGADEKKDQSYFLGLLPADQLKTLCFPVGDMTKDAVRRAAEERGLAPVIKKESQDICFIRPQMSYADFIRQQGLPLPPPGVIEDVHGKVIGKHPGIHHFTIGQRRGINCPAAQAYYVAAIDAETNKIVVGFRDELLVKQCVVEQTAWFVRPDRWPLFLSVKMRYRHPAVPVSVSLIDDERVSLDFDEPQFGVAPGQGAVFYDNALVVGGGIVAS